MLSHAAAPTSLRLAATVSGDAGELVREVRIHTRSADGPWELHAGTSTEVPLTTSQSIYYFATAVGPGGAVLCADGSETAPLRFVVEPVATEPQPDEPLLTEPAPTDRPAGPEPADGGSNTGLWIGLGAGVAVAVGVVAVILLSGSDQTVPTAPMVDWPMP
jgi:hypothetical protein